MKKMNFKIPLGLYPFSIMVSIGQTDEELISSVRKYNLTREDIGGILNLPPTTNGRTLINRTNHTFIRLRGIPKIPIEHGWVAHEIFHAVDMIFTVIGMQLVQGSEEAYAYAIGYVTEQFYLKIKGKC